MQMDTMTSGMLDIRLLAALRPISSFRPARLRELLDYCHLETFAHGQAPFEQYGLHGQSVYLLQGELEIVYEDDNRVIIRANSEWAKHPLGKRQPEIVSAIALSDIQILRIDDDMLDTMVVWDQFSSHGGKPESEMEAEHDAYASVKRLLNSGMFGAGYFKNAPFFRLPPANIGQLIDRIETVAVYADDVIIRERDEGDYYYMIESGRAQVARMVGGINILLAEIRAGDTFGEEALVPNARHNTTVTMKTNGMLLRVKRQDFLELMQEPLLHRLNYEDAMEKVAKGAIWIDVRHPSEYRHDKLPGAINVPLNAVRDAAGALNKSHAYITYCQSGRRSSAAAFIFSQAGYDVYVLESGLWTVQKPQQQ